MGNKEEFDDTLLVDEDPDEEDVDEENPQKDSDEDPEKDTDEDPEKDSDDAEKDSDEEPEGDEGADSKEDEAEPTDKKEKKIIALKREIKEANKRIADLERVKAETRIDEQVAEAKQKMLDDGYSEKDVEEFAKLMKENATLKQKQDDIEWDSLKNKYPNITKYRDEIQSFRKTLPEASIEDIYLAKFSKLTAYDEKTRIEQETLYKNERSSAKASGNLTGGKNTKPMTRLSASDERAYLEAVKMNPSLTKAKFKKLLEEEELT